MHAQCFDNLHLSKLCRWKGLQQRHCWSQTRARALRFHWPLLWRDTSLMMTVQPRNPSSSSFSLPETLWMVCLNVPTAEDPCTTTRHFRSMWNRGCPQFDLNRPIGSHVPCAWPWLCVLALPDLPKELLHREEALEVIKTTCVLCGQKLGHSRHVLAHLQHDHEPILTQAKQAYPHLVEQLKEINPCCCDCIRPTWDHQCSVHTQIQVLHFVCKTKNQPHLHLLSRDAQPYLEVWNDPTLRAKLTQCCSLCDQECGIMGMQAHLNTHTDLCSDMAPFVHLAQSPFMDCCPACMDAESAPTDCPVALNICSYVLQRTVGYAGRGLHGPDRGLSGTLDHRAQRQQEETRSSAAAKIPTSKARPTAASIVAPTRASSRKPATSSSNGRPIYTFFASRPGRDHPSLGAGNLPLERADREEDHCHPSSPTPVPDSHTGTGHSPRCLGQSTADGSFMAEGPGATHADQGGDMAVPTVRPSTEEDDSHREETGGHASDAADDHGTPRTGQGSQSDPAVQMPEETWTQPREAGHTMAATGVPSPPTPLGYPDYIGPVQCMGPSTWETQTAPIADQSSSRDLGQKSARRIPRAEAGRACLSASLANDGVICYVNANILATTWSLLQVKNADWEDYGVCEKGIQRLLMSEAHPKFALESDVFDTLKSRWGTFRQQADSHEFLATLLEWARMPLIDVSWQRRVSVLEQVQISDQGSRGTPPTLVANDPEKTLQPLQALINEWHTYCGMHTCFNTESELLCMHIDRFANHSGAVERTDWHLGLQAEVQLPFWNQDQSMAISWRDYTVVALVMHEGQDRAGHLQAALHTPEGYFITNDGCIAQAKDPTLVTRLQDIILVWVVANRVYSPSGIAAPQWGKDDLVHRLAILIHQDRMHEIPRDPKLMKLLRTSCGACGCLLFSAETMDNHYKEHHPGLWLELNRTYRQMVTLLTV